MLSLELVTQIQAGSSVVTPFQPYWEILIDYSLTGLLLTVVLGLAGVTLTGNYEISCLPILNGTSSTTDYNVMLFVNSRCSRVFGGRFLLYYPYLILIAYLILLFGHLLTVKLPSTSSFLNLMFHLFAEFKELRKSSSLFGGRVVSNTEEQLASNDVKKGGKLYKILKLEAKEHVLALVERLIAAVKLNSSFFVAYVAKSVILLLGSALVMSGNIVTLFIFDWSLVFDCDIAAYVPLKYDISNCTIPAAPFLYGLMVISSAFAFFVFLFTLRAIVWLIQTRNYQSRYLESWGEGKHVLSDQPGFHDFCFCLMLMKNNGSDGEGVYETVNSSLKIYTTLKIQQYLENDQLLGTTVASDVQLERDNYICDFMLKEMGMVSREVSEASGLIAALARIYHSLQPENMPDDSSNNMKDVTVRKAIFDELVSHPTLYKDMVDNGSESLLSFREYARSIIDGSFVSGEVSECLYILMSFVNTTRVKIVLLRPHESSLIFTPVPTDTSGEEPVVIFLKHVPPSDYICVTSLEDASAEQHTNGEKFLEDKKYPEVLRQKALESWRTSGYPTFLETLKGLLPKYLTGAEDSIDVVDSGAGPSNTTKKAFKAHLAFLEELGITETVAA